MKFESKLIEGRLIKRYKRFFVDIELNDHQVITAHCPSTGSMRGLLVPGAKCYVRFIDDPKRKLKYTWEIVENHGTLVGVNTQNPNRFIAELLKDQRLSFLSDYDRFTPEVKYGEKSKIDFYLQSESKSIPPCFVEVKNVHDREGDYGTFPDSITTRGQKHLRELIAQKQQGYRAVVLYTLQRSDVDQFAVAGFIDEAYANLFIESQKIGVEHYALQFAVAPDGIEYQKCIPIAAPLMQEVV